jgi:hypothetical protein
MHDPDRAARSGLHPIPRPHIPGHQNHWKSDQRRRTSERFVGFGRQAAYQVQNKFISWSRSGAEDGRACAFGKMHGKPVVVVDEEVTAKEKGVVVA